MSHRPQRIYFDYNASAPLRPEAREAMQRATVSFDANPSSVHHEGREARNALERARSELASAVGGSVHAMVLTSSASEANNLAIKGALALGEAHSTGIAVTTVEHPSVLAPAEWMAQVGLAERCLHLEVDSAGQVLEASLDEAFASGVGLVSVIAANNETGVILDIPSIARRAHASGALIHVDATQAVGRIPVDVEAWGVDLLTFSSHKLGGPLGAGALWVRPGLRLEPLVHGGHQERNRRGGTENVLAAVGFSAAASAGVNGLQNEARRLASLRDDLWAAFEGIGGVHRIGGHAHVLPNTLHVAFEGVEAETLLMALDIEGISASAGSACTAGSLEASHVLLAMGINKTLARSAIRFSMGWATTEAEVAYAVETVPQLIHRMRELSA